MIYIMQFETRKLDSAKIGNLVVVVVVVVFMLR